MTLKCCKNRKLVLRAIAEFATDVLTTFWPIQWQEQLDLIIHVLSYLIWFISCMKWSVKKRQPFLFVCHLRQGFLMMAHKSCYPSSLNTVHYHQSHGNLNIILLWAGWNVEWLVIPFSRLVRLVFQKLPSWI